MNFAPLAPAMIGGPAARSRLPGSLAAPIPQRTDVLGYGVSAHAPASIGTPIFALPDGKPPVGTPPFAPPHTNTVGSEPPARAETSDAVTMAMQQLLADPQRPAQRGLAGFFERMVNPTNALGQFGQALVIGGGSPQHALAHMAKQRQHSAEEQRERSRTALELARWQQDRADKIEEREAKRNEPQYFTGSEDRVSFDPVTGEATVIYDAPTPAEAYATALGLDLSTDAGRKAVQDYVLRSSGPTALEGDLTLEGARYANRAKLKGTPTYRQANPLPGAPARAPRPTRSAAPSIPEGATATGPGGRKIIRRGGKWVPLG